MDEAMTSMDRGMENAPMTGHPDHDFVAKMIPHHQGAVDMAKVELLYGTKAKKTLYLALEGISDGSNIGQNKCADMERRLKMEQQTSDNGIINKPSKYSVKETLDRLEAVLKSKGITIFARVDQKAAAEKVGLSMQATELLIFGDPKAGTPLMNAYPSLAIDLPLKVVAWKSKDGGVILSYDSPEYLKRRHGLAEVPFRAVEALIEKALE
jgi:uncharacterized protein (DUF302 family)